MRSTTSWDSGGGWGGLDGAEEQAPGPCREGEPRCLSCGHGGETCSARRSPALMNWPSAVWRGTMTVGPQRRAPLSVSGRWSLLCAARQGACACLPAVCLPLSAAGAAVGTFYRLVTYWCAKYLLSLWTADFVFYSFCHLLMKKRSYVIVPKLSIFSFAASILTFFVRNRRKVSTLPAPPGGSILQAGRLSYSVDTGRPPCW